MGEFSATNHDYFDLFDVERSSKRKIVLWVINRIFSRRCRGSLPRCFSHLLSELSFFQNLIKWHIVNDVSGCSSRTLKTFRNNLSWCLNSIQTKLKAFKTMKSKTQMRYDGLLLLPVVDDGKTINGKCKILWLPSVNNNNDFRKKIVFISFSLITMTVFPWRFNQSLENCYGNISFNHSDKNFCKWKM